MAPKGEAPADKLADKPADKAGDKAGDEAGDEGAPDKKAPDAKDLPQVDAAAVAANKKVLIFCGVVVMLSIAVIAVMFLKYEDLKELQWPITQPFKELRETLATAVNEPQFLHNQPKDVAEEVQLLPTKIEQSQRVYQERKQKYKSLFYKAMRSASGPWQFHRRSLYYFSQEEKTWYEAEDFCISRDAHLASIRDDEEQIFITSHLPHASWIGLTEGNEEGTWGWSDGSTLRAQYWSDGRPRNMETFERSNQDCALVVPSVTYHNWHDESCHKHHSWVCKENLDVGEP